MAPPPVFLLDGGLGTTLADEFSVKFNNSTPLWSSDLLISDSTTLLRAQSSFATAGADILLTATYQASARGFALTPRVRSAESTSAAAPGDGYSADDAAEYMRKAVRIARDAFNLAGKDASTEERQGKIALSLGAYGATMHPVSTEYSGDYDAAHRSVEQLAEWHLERLSVFTRPDVLRKIEYVAFETLPRVDEVKAVRKAMKGVDVPFWIACVFPGEGNALPDGSSVADVVAAALDGDDPKPVALGLNCTKIFKVRGIIAEFEAALEKRGGVWPGLVVYPDGAQGLVYDTEAHEWKVKEGAEKVNWDETVWEIVKEVSERGKWKSVFVGGCCKTTAEDIKGLRKRIDGEL